jgi:hypothetical protein
LRWRCPVPVDFLHTVDRKLEAVSSFNALSPSSNTSSLFSPVRKGVLSSTKSSSKDTSFEVEMSVMDYLDIVDTEDKEQIDVKTLTTGK